MTSSMARVIQKSIATDILVQIPLSHIKKYGKEKCIEHAKDVISKFANKEILNSIYGKLGEPKIESQVKNHETNSQKIYTLL